MLKVSVLVSEKKRWHRAVCNFYIMDLILEKKKKKKRITLSCGIIDPLWQKKILLNFSASLLYELSVTA